MRVRERERERLTLELPFSLPGDRGPFGLSSVGILDTVSVLSAGLDHHPPASSQLKVSPEIQNRVVSLFTWNCIFFCACTTVQLMLT